MNTFARRHSAPALIALATALLPGCGKNSAAPLAPVTPSSQNAHSAASPVILNFADFVQAEGGAALMASSSSTTSTSGELLVEAQAPIGPCDKICIKRRQEFRYVVYVGKQIYAYWEQKKADTRTDFDALARDLEQSITTDMSTTSYFWVLRRWAAAFHDGHVNAIYKTDDSDYEIFTAPVRLEILAPATDHEKVVVSQLVPAKGFEAEKLDIKPGDQVIAINGKPIRQVLDENEKLTSGSTARMRRVDSARRLVDAIGTTQGALPLSLTLSRLDRAGTTEVTLYRSAELSAPKKPATDDEDTTGAEYFRAVVLPGSIGYLRMDAFVGTQDEFLIGQAMQLLSGTQGLLIDVRRNGGGDQSGNVLLARLATSALTRYKTSPRMSDFTLANRPEYFALSWKQGSPFADWNDERIEAAKPQFQYAGKPVVLLTSTDCFSACDTFTSAIKTNSLGTIVGEPTGGGTGTPLVFKLPVSGFSFRYSVVRGQTTDGKPLEGVGTTPDVLIERTQAERVSGHDQQLLTAIEVLARQIHDRNVPLAPSVPPQATEMALSQGLSDLGPVWSQDAALSPTRSLERKLSHLSAFDEARSKTP